MPAVTVPDLTVLPALTRVPTAAVRRPVVSLTAAPGGLEGEGFPVKRAFSGVDLALLDPFIMMDEMGEVDYGPGEPKGTPWHPHRGFETVTYIIDGTFVHEDSYGGGGTITNGATQWMTAGSGILHIERPPEQLVVSGGLFHGLQLWVNLRRADKLATPRYQDLAPADVALLSSPDGGSLVRVIAGTVDGHTGPGLTHTPMAMVHATVAPGARLELPWRTDFNALVYVMGGLGTVGPAATPIGPGRLAVLAAGEVIDLTSNVRQEARYAAGLEVVVLGGRPIREPVAWAGPFVMNTRAELVAAFEDYQSGRLGRPVPNQPRSAL
jgi:redox-sensitive bicupin YhaK (pirin superfamily)